LRPDVDRGFDAEAIEALLDPNVRVSPPSRMKVGEETPICVELGRGAELLHHRVPGDTEDEKPFQATGLDQALVNKSRPVLLRSEFGCERETSAVHLDEFVVRPTPPNPGSVKVLDEMA
jgi:hypothetical protein